jgi:3-deoxy-D-manno-octulosonic-acid transferase
LFILLYSLLLTLALALSAPWWLWRMATSNRYREGLTQRLGFVPPALRQAVQGSKTIWLHAVSVGEVLAAERLVRELRERLPGCAVVVSTTTAAGQKIARERFGAELVFYLPLDFAFAVRPYLRAIRPQMLILMESELWPRLLFECERAAIPVAVVNARISDRSFPRYLRMRALWRPLLAKVALFLAQGDETAERLRRIGAPPERVQVSGNLKYDLQPGEETRMKSLLRSASRGRHILVAGSTVSGKPWNEEELLFQAMDQVWSEMPQVLLVLAPRHPQRFPYARSLALEHGVTAASELDGGRSLPLLRHTLLLDTLGDLSSLYREVTIPWRQRASGCPS